MEQKIVFPDRAQRMYSDDEYTKAMEKAGGDRKTALSMEEARGCGFGFLYMDCVHRMLDIDNNPRLRAWQREAEDLEQREGAGPDILCGLLNSQFENVRHSVCSMLNDYANSRGFIDAWPSPLVRAGVVKYGKKDNKKTDGVYIMFGHFAKDFTYRKESDIDLIFRIRGYEIHPYRSSLKEPRELVVAKSRASELRKVPKPTWGERRASIFKWFIARIPLVLMLLLALLIVIGVFTGFDPRDLPGGQPDNGIVGFLAALYMFMTSSEFVFFSMLPGLIISGFVMTGILKLLLDADWISKEEVEEGIKAKEELERLENDPLYPRLEREYRRQRQLEQEQIDAWQTEWFEVCKAKGYFKIQI